MKKNIYSVLLLMAVLFTACSDDNDKLPAVTPTDHGTVVDNDGNTYGWVRIGDLLWTTSNANNGPDAWDFDFYNRSRWVPVLSNDYGNVSQSTKDYVNDEYRPQYGNLMNYASAVASAPDGWRLPSDEDWQKLEQALGIVDTRRDGAGGNGQAFKLQEKDSGTELGMLPGGAILYGPTLGYVVMRLHYEEVYGYYWTSTKVVSSSDEECAYFRKFLVGQGKIWRVAGSTQQFMSVRWVKDAE